jgi:hypothetical protein
MTVVNLFAFAANQEGSLSASMGGHDMLNRLNLSMSVRFHVQLLLKMAPPTCRLILATSKKHGAVSSGTIDDSEH